MDREHVIDRDRIEMQSGGVEEDDYRDLGNEIAEFGYIRFDPGEFPRPVCRASFLRSNDPLGREQRITIHFTSKEKKTKMRYGTTLTKVKWRRW